MEVRLAELLSDEEKWIKTATTVDGRWLWRCHSLSNSKKILAKSSIRPPVHKYKKDWYPSSQWSCGGGGGLAHRSVGLKMSGSCGGFSPARTCVINLGVNNFGGLCWFQECLGENAHNCTKIVHIGSKQDYEHLSYLWKCFANFISLRPGDHKEMSSTYLGWPIAPSYMSPNVWVGGGGGGGVWLSTPVNMEPK